MPGSLNLLHHPVLLSSPRRLTPFSAWHEHIPFAMFLIELLKPNFFVELGTQFGDSYCAFCQAVQQLDLGTRCYAIDNWEGDSHTGFYSPEVLADLRSHHDPLYGNFSSLVKSTFDDALKHFSDGLIDLLHIDGYHTYEVVRHDFESWLPKTSSRGVILFHDINVREADFGVWRLWDELKERYPYIEFIHGHGLGVLAVGPEQPETFQRLLQASPEEVLTIRNFFFQLGLRLTLKAEQQAQLAAERDRFNAIVKEQQETITNREQQLAHLQATIQGQQQALDAKGQEVVQLQAERNRLNQEAAHLQAAVQGQQQALDAKGREWVQLQAERDRLEQEAAHLQATIQGQQQALDTKEQQLAHLQAAVQGQQQALDAKGQEVVQLQAERNRLNQEAAHLQAAVQGQQQELDGKGQELVQHQAVARVQEQELATIKNTIGWKALNKYRETREKSAVFRYLHFLFTEPVKRGSKKKINKINNIPYEATDLISPNEIPSSDCSQPSIIERPGTESAEFVPGTEKRLREMNLPARDYPSWRQSRLTDRLHESARLVGLRNNLISLIVYVIDAGKVRARLDATLRSLLQQTYRNIEVLVVGEAIGNVQQVEDFASYRGLFFERGLSHLDILRDLHADRLWRGDHLMFVMAGTMFDADTFVMLNAALSTRGPDLVLCDHDRVAGTHEFSQPSFTPGWDPDLIQSHDYIETAFVASRGLIQRRRPQATSCASLHDWLRMIAQEESHLATHHVTETLVHIPQPDPAPPPPVPLALKPPCTMPDLSVIIPNRNRPDLLAQCLSFMELPNRFRTELVIVDNASDDADVLSLYAQLRERKDAKILSMNQKFNFARMVNIGVAASTSPIFLLLNNDVQITSPGLVEQMLVHALRPEVGVVGTKLLNADGSVQHGGMLLREGYAGVKTMLALHVLRGARRGDAGYLNALSSVRNYQAVTGALMASRREVFLQVGGFDEVYLPVEFNDVDYCLRVRKAGFRVLCLPLDGIFHFESSTRGTELSPEVARMRQAAMRCMAGRWREEFRHDPYRNPWVELGNVAQARFLWSDGREVYDDPGSATPDHASRCELDPISTETCSASINAD